MVHLHLDLRRSLHVTLRYRNDVKKSSGAIRQTCHNFKFALLKQEIYGKLLKSLSFASNSEIGNV